MKVYATEAIRNLAVIGHGDAGKTQLISSLLYVAGATPRWGKVDEGTTVTDYEEDSIARKITHNTAIAHLDHRDTKLNFIDTPGYAAFIAHARPGLRVLYMSGYTDDEMLRRGLAQPGSAFLEKPFTAERLARAVRDALDGPR